MAYRRLQEHVGAFREYPADHGDTPEEQELLAAKFMGRWRSGAPLVLAPDADDPELGADPMRNNDFNYKEMDPFGYACPLGRMHAASTRATPPHNMNRRRMIRRGATYGPALPDGAPEDGVDRGIAAFIICASLVRQFEFAQNVWINDKTFHELGNEHDPICGTQDGTPRLHGAQAPDPEDAQGHSRVHHTQGRCVLLPAGPGRLRYLATLGELRIDDDCTRPARTYNQDHVARPHDGRRRISIYWTWSYPWEAQRDPAAMDNRFSTHDRGTQRHLPGLREARVRQRPTSCKASPARWSCSTARRCRSRTSPAKLTGHPVAVFQRVDQAGYPQPIDERILDDTDTLMVFGLDHLTSGLGG